MSLRPKKPAARHGLRGNCAGTTDGKMSTTNCPPIVRCNDHAFYLDLDGTLAEIVARPEQAMISAGMRGLITQLAAQTSGAVAIVSGRALADVDRVLHPLHLPVAGSHGQELRGAGPTDQGSARDGIDDDALHRITTFAARLGLLAERKPGSVALHYRSAPQHVAASRALIDSLVARDDRYRAIHGKMVSELALRACDKGTAIAALSKVAPFAGRVPVMIGDDVTDEDGFRMAQALGGLGIKIGTGPTDASHRLASVAALSDWLAALLCAQK
ncbi:trehalose-6-phosphate phosphatase [Pseudosulfitobacter pseudonitzschiae]|uniref:Trehalose 6-phosphate phosphatase n=2 Tax=Rhodobacterales TaxID=204455 RepID=A0A221JX58_9RHOB|nr:trehalose-6-phosphate phosphatase [Pseudosulfitobacter pseudonitzschiae]